MKGQLDDLGISRILSDLIEERENVLWIQTGQIGSLAYKNFAYLALVIAILWALFACITVLIAFLSGTMSSGGWTLAWSLSVYLGAIALPLYMAIELIRTLKSSVHILTDKRLVLTNIRWPNYSLKTFQIGKLQVERCSETGQCNVRLNAHSASSEGSVTASLARPNLLSNIKEPHQFQAALHRYQQSLKKKTGRYRVNKPTAPAELDGSTRVVTEDGDE